MFVAKLFRDKTDQKAIGSFFSKNSTNTHLYSSLQHWDTDWMIAGDEAHDMDILRVKMSAENLKPVQR